MNNSPALLAFAAIAAAAAVPVTRASEETGGTTYWSSTYLASAYASAPEDVARQFGSGQISVIGRLVSTPDPTTKLVMLDGKTNGSGYIALRLEDAASVPAGLTAGTAVRLECVPTGEAPPNAVGNRCRFVEGR